MKPFDLVEVKSELRDSYYCQLPFNERFVFLGEIKQMPGHGIFTTMGKGKMFVGFHMDQFRVVRPEDV